MQIREYCVPGFSKLYVELLIITLIDRLCRSMFCFVLFCFLAMFTMMVIMSAITLSAAPTNVTSVFILLYKRVDPKNKFFFAIVKIINLYFISFCSNCNLTHYLDKHSPYFLSNQKQYVIIRSRLEG